MFKHSGQVSFSARLTVPAPAPDANKIQQISQRIKQSRRPLLLIGGQAVMNPGNVSAIASAINQLNIPVYLTSAARGLLGGDAALQMRHHRKQALREADFVLLAGVPCDFRLEYGKHIGHGAAIVSANRSKKEMYLNCHPQTAVECDPGLLLIALAESVSPRVEWTQWTAQLRQRDSDRVHEIRQQRLDKTEHINPIQLLGELDQIKKHNSIIIADGGDFVATASYILDPPGPLSWLDPGPFGTLGVGAGFALSAKLCHP
ncbi:MAG: thiamine pyrophosphate-binding protein, partial [Gammaproteobacteria bacterium]|nr:thiamine pyrophosphate-binding protein [Gammaproteobacteria bacterium]